MWEDLKVYKQLAKEDINPTFKKFGARLLSLNDGYELEQTASIIKLYRVVNKIEQGVFIEKEKGSYYFSVNTSIKPIDFYHKHRFTMLNITPLGDILNNHRRTTFPLTQEWEDLSIYLTARIKREIDAYFARYDSYDKIIKRRKEIEPKKLGLDNKYELLIYAAIKTKNKKLLPQYIDDKMKRPVMRITQSEFLKPSGIYTNESEFLEQIKLLAQIGDFERIETLLSEIQN